MYRLLFILFLLIGLRAIGNAQLEGLIIETYYVSDQDDATDTLGGYLAPGTKTYRIFADLGEGSLLTGIFGDEDHALKISSTSAFFNHKEEGVSFAKDLNRNRYATGTVALDTYITLGQISRAFAQGAYFGIPKANDPDGSIIGGINNDGGSSEIEGGLLKNSTPEMEIPLTAHDGLIVSDQLPGSWIDIGFADLTIAEDTTIFGSRDGKQQLTSTNVLLRNSGVKGIEPSANHVLIAQLTTAGELSFELNLEVQTGSNGEAHILKYVATNEQLGDGIVFHPLLKYPYACGCTDPDYLEASTSFACTDNSKCLTPIRFGCTDSLACNYDPLANFNVQEICCYIGYCDDKDLSIVCPDLRPRQDAFIPELTLMPNPVSDYMTIRTNLFVAGLVDYVITDITGRVIRTGFLSSIRDELNVTGMVAGCYILHLRAGQYEISASFIHS